MRLVVAALIAVAAVGVALGTEEPHWQGPIATGGAPECPEHPGIRHYRSEIVESRGVKAWIEGTAERTSGRCRSDAVVVVERDAVARRYRLPNPDTQHYDLVDFSPDASAILFQSDLPGFSTSRDVVLAKMSTTNGTMHWENAWDLFDWKDCDATVEAQGFDQDGRVVVRPRPSVLHAHLQPNCVGEPRLYATDLVPSSAVRLPDSTRIVRYGRETDTAFSACKTDPDIAAACFTLHGRLAAYNGTPTLRLWRIGTHRMLGVEDDWPVPRTLAGRLDWDTEAYGDFTVCPFARERPGHMQPVCIESAAHVTYKKR